MCSLVSILSRLYGFNGLILVGVELRASVVVVVGNDGDDDVMSCFVFLPMPKTSYGLCGYDDLPCACVCQRV